LHEGTPRAEGVRYAAFLSYSHKDAAKARRLHRRLETYRIPRRLVGLPGEHGPVPARLTPIFRDREELPAAGDLSQRIRAALAASDHLVILCSPASAASPWVAKEIAAYRELHPGRPVYAAIVEGEPGDCFPSGLAEGGTEPLAADLRSTRDGRRLGLLKLVAGLAGVPLDALVQRDAARRVRRVTAVTAAALVAMLVMAVMTTLALQARREAQNQRAEAEGLVDFMRTDLREQLQKVGRLDIMKTVNARALGYYRARKDPAVATGDSAARQARIYQAVGEDDLERGRADDAAVAFRRAQAATERQLALFPADPQLLLDKARSDNGLGRVHEARGEWEAADLHYRSYADIADPLAVSALAEAAAAAINRGNVAAGRRDYAAAEGHYAKAVDLLRGADRLKPGDPHVLSSLANAEAWLADTFYKRGRWTDSLAARRRQHDVMDTLRKTETRNADADFRYAAADRGLACSLWKTGDRAGAERYFLTAYKAASFLTRRDGENAVWRLLKRKLADDLLHAGLAASTGVTPDQLEPEAGEPEAQGCTRP